MENISFMGFCGSKVTFKNNGRKSFRISTSLCAAAMLLICSSASALDLVPARDAAASGLSEKNKTNFTFGGYIKLDLMASHYSDGEMTAKIGRDFFIPGSIPTNGQSSVAQLDFSAKTSRLFFKTKTETDAGEISTHIEMDFIESGQGDERFSNSYSSRLRHAFVKWNFDQGKSIVAGQTWSNFFNVGALPELVDFVGPVGTLFAIQPQLAFQTGRWVFSAENPTTTFHSGDQLINNENNRLPDFTARFNGQISQGSYSLSLLARELAAVDQSNKTYTHALALSASAKLKVNESNDVRFMINYGDGLGRYMGFNSFRDAYLDEDDNVEAITQVGGYVAVRHNWNSYWRSTIAVSASHAENPDLVSFNPAQSYESAHLNLLYSPVHNMDTGVEFIYGEKTMENDQSGKLYRIQFGMKYTF